MEIMERRKIKLGRIHVFYTTDAERVLEIRGIALNHNEHFIFSYPDPNGAGTITTKGTILSIKEIYEDKKLRWEIEVFAR